LDDEIPKDDNEGVEDTPTMGKKESTARFYFTLTLQLANEDITKIKQIDKMSVYLVLNTASILKDKRTKEINEMKKQQTKYVS
jgi:hypothetical protein